MGVGGSLSAHIKRIGWTPEDGCYLVHGLWPVPTESCEVVGYLMTYIRPSPADIAYSARLALAAECWPADCAGCQHSMDTLMQTQMALNGYKRARTVQPCHNVCLLSGKLSEHLHDD